MWFFTPCFRSAELDFERGPGDAALPNDRLRGPDSDFWMIWGGNRHCAEVRAPLHHDMTATLTDHLKPVLFEDAADGSSGEDAEFTHAPLQSG